MLDGSLGRENVAKYTINRSKRAITQVNAYAEIAAEALLLAEPRVEYLSIPKVLDAILLSQQVQEKLHIIDKLQAQWQALRPMDLG